VGLIGSGSPAPQSDGVGIFHYELTKIGEEVGGLVTVVLGAHHPSSSLLGGTATPEELLTLLAIGLATALIGWLAMWCVIVVVDVLGSARPSNACH
jgi:hypothetical protein